MSERLEAEHVAEWLRRNPDFLRDFSDLALSLVMPREDGRTTSLASYQLDVLREKNRELNRRLHELFANAEANERLTVRTHQLTLALMRERTAADSLRAMVASLGEDFAGDAIRVVLHHPVDGLDAVEWLRVVARDDPALEPFAGFFRAGEPLCGRLRRDKHEFLFGADADAIHSAALLALPDHGLLAIGSADANRFYPGMGTLFLRLMSEALVTALARFERG
ncbi:MAG TPA: DUF484 domain-containing protein [Xanthomonadales bacterium]|nr:DUF484 domain-containing protein [Xanthomonadales bacterium]